MEKGSFPNSLLQDDDFFFSERVLRQPTVHVALFYLRLNSKLHVNIYFLDG